MKTKTVQFSIYVLVMIALIIFSFGCSGPRHFDELAAAEEGESSDVIPYLQLKSGEIVADLGAGGGYFSFRLAKAVGESGKVYAVDISEESIFYIRNKVKINGIRNVEAILASYEDSKLKRGSIDLIFIRNAYHDIQNRVEYFSRLKSALKPGGRIAIIDYDPAKLNFFRKLFGHALEEKTILMEMNRSGYFPEQSHLILKEQSFNIFLPKKMK